jgi:hypothetical protein
MAMDNTNGSMGLKLRMKYLVYPSDGSWGFWKITGDCWSQKKINLWDDSGESKSKDLNDSFMEKGVKNLFQHPIRAMAKRIG